MCRRTLKLNFFVVKIIFCVLSLLYRYVSHWGLGVKWDVYPVHFSCHILVFLYFVSVHVF